MTEVDHALLETLKDELDTLSNLTEKAEIELALKRNELMVPVLEKRRAIIAKIPKFWSTVFQLSSAMTQLITEEDIPALEHLTDVWVKHDSKDPRIYDIVFTFSENPYFSNKELVKKVAIKDDQDEPYCQEYEIKWKDGKDLTKKRKKDEAESFFSWFSDDDAMLAQIFANDIFQEALSIYTNEGDEDDGFDDGESVDLEDDEEEEEEEEEEHPKKKSKK